jgi:hypothetical protein
MLADLQRSCTPGRVGRRLGAARIGGLAVVASNPRRIRGNPRLVNPSRSAEIRISWIFVRSAKIRIW